MEIRSNYDVNSPLGRSLIKFVLVEEGRNQILHIIRATEDHIQYAPQSGSEFIGAGRFGMTGPESILIEWGSFTFERDARYKRSKPEVNEEEILEDVRKNILEWLKTQDFQT